MLIALACIPFSSRKGLISGERSETKVGTRIHIFLGKNFRMLSKASQRTQLAYSMATTRAYEDFGMKTEQLIEDYLDAMYQRYPFNHDQTHRDSLHVIVMRQLRHVVYKIKDMKHIAFIEMEKSSIDWLAQPYFRGEQGVRLSSIIEEYDYYYSNPTYTPSRACQDMFRISAHAYQAESPKDTASGWDEDDSQTNKRSRES